MKLLKTLTFLVFGLSLLSISLSAQGLTYHPITPCRILDTRVDFQFPSLQAGIPLNVPLALAVNPCGLPNNLTGPAAYSINVTVVPKGAKVSFLVVWATGTPIPNISTLNSPSGLIVANHAIVQALENQSRSISFQSTDNTDLVVDIDGYFN